MTDDAAAEQWVPSACTLPAVEQPLRAAEFDDLFRQLRSVDRAGPGQLALTFEQGAGEAVQDLVRRESQCCSFFAFTVDEQDDRVLLEVAVPAVHVEVLDALAERAARVAKLSA